MLPREQMRFGTQILAAMFGGPGVFYLWKSFYDPQDALTALLYLGVATALSLAIRAPKERQPARINKKRRR
jgi:hypothetical protein